MIDLVCSVCGSKNWYGSERSMDERWVIARCRDHSDKRNPLTPLISARAFTRRQRRRADANPEDVFGSMPEDERSQLRQPIKFTDLTRR